MNNNPIIPVILCGGSGTRLWPLSRNTFPKQYLSINNQDNKSMLQKTYQRVSNLKNLKEPIIVCSEDHRFIVAEQMREINVKPSCILLEPFGRNTAPAIASSALCSLEIEKDPILIILSSDHVIENEEKFLEVINKGIQSAKENKLITFGVVPTSPEIGYGYIKSQKPFKKSEIKATPILSFHEKPSLELAKKFLLDKSYTWNSGIFLFKAEFILNEMNKLCPDIINLCKESLNKSKLDLDFRRLDKTSFSKCKNISIDIAVFEKTKISYVLPLEAGWSDVGDWHSIWKKSKKDKDGNALSGKVITEDTKNCLIRAESRLVATLGVSNLSIIETSDAILISEFKSAQKVKNIVEILKRKKMSEGQSHNKIYRPWGNYLSVVEDNRWQVKLITVKPGEKLSLQLHHHRSEHWIVVSGTALVEINREKILLSENESTYIPLGSKHRLTNPGKIPLLLIEVQSGSYVGEDDIVRFSDKYGRTGK